MGRPRKGANRLAEGMVERFRDEAEGRFFHTCAAHGDLIVRTGAPYDGALSRPMAWRTLHAQTGRG